MRPRFKRTIGIVLIGLGVLALLTPFTPGAWLALIGLEFLGAHSVILDKLRKKKPQ